MITSRSGKTSKTPSQEDERQDENERLTPDDVKSLKETASRGRIPQRNRSSSVIGFTLILALPPIGGVGGAPIDAVLGQILSHAMSSKLANHRSINSTLFVDGHEKIL